MLLSGRACVSVYCCSSHKLPRLRIQCVGRVVYGENLTMRLALQSCPVRRYSMLACHLCIIVTAMLSMVCSVCFCWGAAHTDTCMYGGSNSFTCIMQEKVARVEDLINKLALQSCQNVLLGSPLARGVSGGEAKRSNIGIALVTSPKVLFLDEPTSGLDSYTANEVSSAAEYMLLDIMYVMTANRCP